MCRIPHSAARRRMGRYRRRFSRSCAPFLCQHFSSGQSCFFSRYRQQASAALLQESGFYHGAFPCDALINKTNRRWKRFPAAADFVPLYIIHVLPENIKRCGASGAGAFFHAGRYSAGSCFVKSRRHSPTPRPACAPARAAAAKLTSDGNDPAHAHFILSLYIEASWMPHRWQRGCAPVPALSRLRPAQNENAPMCSYTANSAGMSAASVVS